MFSKSLKKECCAIIALLLGFSCIAADVLPLAATPSPRLLSFNWMPLSEWYRMHADDIDIAEKGESKILFIGDSIIQGFESKGAKYWNEHFAPLGAANFGIGGDMTQNVLWRLENGGIGNLLPERIIILVGTNNFGHSNENPAQVYVGMRAVVHKLKEAFPSAKLLLMAVFPRKEESDDPDRDTIKDLNDRVQRMEYLDDVTYLDIGNEFLLEDGRIPKSLMPDFLHPSEEGYGIWTDYILKWIEDTRLPAE